MSLTCDRRMRDRIEHRHEIGRVLRRAVDLAVGVDRRVAPVGGDLVVQIVGRRAPVPQRDDHVALEPRRARRLRLRQLAGGDAVGPVGEILQRMLGIELADVADHDFGGRTDLHAVGPGRKRAVELAELGFDHARRLVAELVAGAAALRLDVGEPHRLAAHVGGHSVALRPGAGEQALVRNFHHRVPPLRRVVLGGRSRRRRRHRGEIEDFSGRRPHLRGIDQAVAAHPDAVGGLRQFRQDVAAFTVGDDDLGEFGGQVGGFRDHPDAGLRALGAAHDPAEVAVADRDTARGLLCSGHRRSG